MTAYCDATSVALYLGRALTAAETASAAAACAAATMHIDRFVGKSWQGTTISGELQTVNGPTVYLDRRPVASITSITSRSLVVGQTPRTLTAGVDYELIDPLNGVLLVNGYGYDVITTTSWGCAYLTITYVVGSPAPADIQLAANIIAASYLVAAPAASQQQRGIQKLKAGSAEITYDPIDVATAIPPMAQTLLNAYRPAFSFV